MPEDPKELGYETGSGFMVGLPGQTPLTLAKDLLLLKEIPCRMAGIATFHFQPQDAAGRRTGRRYGDGEAGSGCSQAAAAGRQTCP